MSRWLGLVLGGATAIATTVALASPPALGDARKEVRVLDGAEDSGYLGVEIQDVEGPASRGARVEDVRDDSPAAKAGFRKGDILVRFDGEAVRSAQSLRRLVRETPPGRSVVVEVTRNGAAEKLTATLDRRRGPGPDDEGPIHPMVFPEPPEPPEALGDSHHHAFPLPPEAEGQVRDLEGLVRAARGSGGFWWSPREGGPRKLGIEFQEIRGQLAKYFHLDAEQGILVASVDDDGPASKAGMKAGDVILKVAGNAVRGEHEMRHAVRALEPGKETLITVQREGRMLDLKLVAGGEKRPAPEQGPTT